MESIEQLSTMVIQLQTGAKNAVNTIQQGDESIEISNAKTNEINNNIDTIINVSTHTSKNRQQLLIMAEEINNSVNVNIAMDTFDFKAPSCGCEELGMFLKE